MSIAWQNVSLGEICTTQYGLSVAASEDGTTPILGMRNLQEGRVVLEGLSRACVADSEIESCCLGVGDLLFNRTNSSDLVGKTALVEEPFSEKTVFASYLLRLRVDESFAIPGYVNHFLNSPESEKRLKNMATPGVSQFNINATSLRNHFRILLPSLAEQRRIVSVLDQWDSGIQQLSCLLNAKFGLKQGLMEQMLSGANRFRNFKDEWCSARLSDVTEECNERNRGRLGLESVMAVTKADGIVPMRERTVGASIDRYLVVQKNCFAYNPMRINIGSIARWQGDNDILVSPDYVVFRCKEETKDFPGLDSDFLDHFRRSKLWEKFVMATGNGSVRIRIYYSELSRLKLKLPSLAEQKKIAELLNAMDREIDLLRKQLDLLKLQKKGLMQKLLTGQVRVKLPKGAK